MNRTISFFDSLNNKDVVLDVGCGEGIHLRKISSSITKGIGFDIASSKIRKAKTASKQIKNVVFIICDAEFIPFRKRIFDVIFCLEVLEHIPNYKKTLLEIKRVSKISVYIILSIPTSSTLWQQFKKRIKGKNINPHFDVGHLHSFTYEQIYKELFNNKFLILDYFPIFLFELPYQHLYSEQPFCRFLIEALDKIFSKIKTMRRFGFWTIFLLGLNNHRIGSN